MLATVLVLSACGSGAASKSTELQGSSGLLNVVAAENFWGDITRQIGGDAVKVTSIISDPTVDPHEYESSAKNAAAIATASLVVTNGLGYDDFMDKLIAASPSDTRSVLNIGEVIKPEGDNPNPHLWYKPEYVLAAATAIQAKLATLRPSAAATFTANLATFTASEQTDVVAVITAIKAKYNGAAIAYTERVPGYLIQAAGLTLGTPGTFSQSIEDGNDPSPSDAAAFDSALAGHKVKALLYNGQVTSPVTKKIKALAVADGIAVVAVTETIPAGEKSFQAWQGNQAKALLAALGG